MFSCLRLFYTYFYANVTDRRGQEKKAFILRGVGVLNEMQRNSIDHIFLAFYWLKEQTTSISIPWMISGNSFQYFSDYMQTYFTLLNVKGVVSHDEWLKFFILQSKVQQKSDRQFASGSSFLYLLINLTFSRDFLRIS